MALGDPSDSSPLADDPDAIPAKHLMVIARGCVNMSKSYIRAFNLADGQLVATDSITLHGLSFSVLSADERHKLLGVHKSKIGDWRTKKLQVLEEMSRRTVSLLSDVILSAASAPVKECALTTGALPGAIVLTWFPGR